MWAPLMVNEYELCVCNALDSIGNTQFAKIRIVFLIHILHSSTIDTWLQYNKDIDQRRHTPHHFILDSIVVKIN